MSITNTLLEYGVEPYDKDWGTGTSGLGDGNFSPYERIGKHDELEPPARSLRATGALL